ncbi:MAG: YitT family protein [Rikenellaceae bacterium]|nr:YitT family protein [Rikenellaceae bacterium]
MRQDKRFDRQFYISLSMLVAGSFILASAFVLFITPYKIIPGGIYGIGIILHHFSPSVKVGTFGLMMDVPLVITAIMIFGKKFGFRTVIAALLTPVIMNLLTVYIGEDPEIMLQGKINLSDQVLLASLIGGVTAGAAKG